MVSVVKIDGGMLKNMIIAGSNELRKNMENIDALNVFPVPDGDTGTNMTLAMEAAVNELFKSECETVAEVAKAVSGGALRGARGNSGVILSQIFRGFSKGLENKAVANTKDIAFAFTKSAETAYKAVMKPKEGTILTIVSALAEKAAECAHETSDMQIFFEAIINHGNKVLLKTTDMLPELKQANVVDAGGKGLMCIVSGMMTAFTEAPVFQPFAGKPKETRIQAEFDTDSIELEYCTEFFIKCGGVTEEDESNLKAKLIELGDSIALVSDSDIYKVHIHTNHPGAVLELALKFGTLDNIKIDNMRIQHSSLISFNSNEKTNVELFQQNQRDKIGFVAVASGPGLREYFENLGVNFVVDGGQTMNPSIDEIIKAAESVHADDVIILPNNSNIVLAANQAAKMAENLHVLPTTSIPQGISAMVSYLPIKSVEENMSEMSKAIKCVKTGLVTYAVRDSAIDGLTIEQGDVISILENKIVSKDTDIQECVKKLLPLMLDGEGDIVGIYYGNGVTEADSAMLAEFIEKSYSDYEVEVKNGGQAVYYYIISVE